MPIATGTPPDWFVQILQQFPIATLAFAALALGVWWQSRGHREALDRHAREHAEVLKRADAEIERLTAAQAAADERHRVDLANRTEFYERQVMRLQDRVRELEQKPSRGSRA